MLRQDFYLSLVVCLVASLALLAVLLPALPRACVLALCIC